MSICWTLGLFLPLAVLTNTAWCLGLQMPLSLSSVLLGYKARGALLGQVIVLCLTATFFYSTCMLTLTSGCHKDSSLFSSSPTLVIFCLFVFDISHSDIFDMVFHSGFSFHFLNWTFFMCLVATCVSWRKVSSSLLPIFELGCSSFCCWIVRVFKNIFWIVNPYDSCDLKIFSPIPWIIFLLTMSFDTQNYNFNED